MTESAARSEGIVLAVRGAVVDVRFDAGHLPPIDEELVIEWDRPSRLKTRHGRRTDQYRVEAQRALSARAPVAAGGDNHGNYRTGGGSRGAFESCLSRRSRRRARQIPPSALSIRR